MAWFLLRIFGAKLDRQLILIPRREFYSPWNLVMEAGSCLGPGVDCYSVDRITLGCNAVVSQRAFICTASHDHRSPGFPLKTAPVMIGDNACSCKAYIAPGVTVGVAALSERAPSLSTTCRLAPSWLAILPAYMRACAARGRSCDATQSTMTIISVTVVIPVKNEEKNLPSP